MKKIIFIIMVFTSLAWGWGCIPPSPCVCSPYISAQFSQTAQKYKKFFKDLNHEIKEQMKILDKQNSTLQTVIKYHKNFNEFEHKVNLMALKYEIYTNNTLRQKQTLRRDKKWKF